MVWWMKKAFPEEMIFTLKLQNEVRVCQLKKGDKKFCKCYPLADPTTISSPFFLPAYTTQMYAKNVISQTPFQLWLSCMLFWPWARAANLWLDHCLPDQKTKLCNDKVFLVLSPLPFAFLFFPFNDLLPSSGILTWCPKVQLPFCHTEMTSMRQNTGEGGSIAWVPEALSLAVVCS